MAKAKTKVVAVPKVRVTGKQCKAFRNAHRINQYDFWSALGVTQSGGSRYESGRSMPQPVQNMVAMVWEIGGNAGDLHKAFLAYARATITK